MAVSVQQTELLLEDSSNQKENIHQLADSSTYPAVIVEQIPHTHLLSYSGLACEHPLTSGHLGSVLEQETAVGLPLAVESYQSGDEDAMETVEAAEALINMDSPGLLGLDEKQLSQVFAPCFGEDSASAGLQISMMDAVNAQQWVQLQKGIPPETKAKPKRGRKPRRARAHSPMPDITVKKSKDSKGNTLYLWEFLIALLQDRNACPKYIKWTNREKGIFKLVDSKAVSQLWGKHKNKPDMNYETMGRALRYYYQRGILNKVEGQRLVYQFADMPKNIVYISDDDSYSGGNDNAIQKEDDIDEEVPSSNWSSDDLVSNGSASCPSKLLSTGTPTKAATQGSRNRRSVNGNQRGEVVQSGGTDATTRAGRPLGLIQQRHLPIVSAEMVRTLQNVQSIQPGRHSVFRTAQMLENLREKQAVTEVQQEQLLELQAHQTEGQADGQGTQIVTLQLVPVPPSEQGMEGSELTSQFIMQAIPDSGEEMTLIVENITLSGETTSDYQQEKTGHFEVVTPTSASGTNSGGASVVTLVGGGQQFVSQPPGTVIHSVVTAQEPKAISGQVCVDQENAVQQVTAEAGRDTGDSQGTGEGREINLETHPEIKMEPLSVVIINDSFVGYPSSS